MSFLGWLVIGIFLICAVGVTDPKQDKESDERARKAAAARERRAKIMQQMAAQQNTFMKVCLVLRNVRSTYFDNQGTHSNLEHIGHNRGCWYSQIRRFCTLCLQIC